MVPLKRPTRAQRITFAEKIMEWGNLVFAGLVVAQLIPGTNPFRPAIFIVGVFTFVTAYLLAYLLTQGGGGNS